MSLRGRSYSDPSYGSEKALYSQLWSNGTRATALVEVLTAPLAPIEIVDWNAVGNTVGTGGGATWVLAATSSLGTHAIATMVANGTSGALGALNAITQGSVTTTGTTHLCGAGGQLNLYSVLSTASPAPILKFAIQYQEHYLQSDT